MKKNDLIKNFSIGFLPILVFIIADEFFGPVIGIIVAIITGIIELLYHYIRYRIIEKFVFFDTGLIIFMGGISLVLHDEIFFKLKPALIELIIVILFGIHAFSSRPILLMLGKRYLGDQKIVPEQARLFRMLSRLMFFILIIHTILIVYSAYFWSNEVWAFISGGLFYIIMGLVLAGQWVYLKYIRPGKPAAAAADNEEWFDIVDEKGNIRGRAPRNAVHGNPELIHPTVHIHIFNNRGKLYLQKRAAGKDLFPGYWDTSVGGHVSSGESVQQALLREAKEELGIDASQAKTLFRYVMKNHWESELVHTFKLNYDGPIKINKDEIETGQFWSVFEIRKMIGSNIFTPNFEQEFELLQKYKII